MCVCMHIYIYTDKYTNYFTSLETSQCKTLILEKRAHAQRRSHLSCSALSGDKFLTVCSRVQTNCVASLSGEGKNQSLGQVEQLSSTNESNTEGQSPRNLR